MNLVWFRNDLRLADNPALFHALNHHSKTQALFILTPKQHQNHGEAPQKFEFIKAHVNDLTKRLAKMGVFSQVFEVNDFSDVPDVFDQLCSKHEISGVFFNTNDWVNEILRDQSVKAVLTRQAVTTHEFHSNYLLPPGTVRKADGSMYHVFTPYKRTFIEALKINYHLPLNVPDAQEEAIDEPKQLAVNFELNDWPIGEQAVADRIKVFTGQNNYHEERDYPAIAGTSQLSPYLAIGVISAQQCLAHALKQQGEAAFNSTWVSELIWRDFYNDLMFEYPKLAKGQTFKKEATDDWVDAPDLYQAWQQGQTGFPIVDAGMRQLLKEGWMHNRVRMIVASFLSKLCLVDWRLGEAHFMAHLLDGDLASNNGGWQWSSATGCDAAPYFRIFNPTTQSKKFDPDGSYIRTYVPELSLLGSKEIHDPRPEIRAANSYPQPVIDYKKARQQALAWFKK